VSGFFGILRLDEKPAESRVLERIAKEMSFRGPDGMNVCNLGRMAGCFALMRTGPAPQAPKQPVGWGDRFWLWGDIRLDARQELLEQLSAEDCVSAVKVTSEELLLRAWAKWGAASLERVIGDFSFALWDATEEVLWCARDFVGARPFYYAQAHGVFCFSNTLQLLRFVPEVSNELDESFLGDYLLEGWNFEAARTVYQDIRRLPAGYLLKLSNGATDVRRFRKLPIEAPLQLSRPEEYVEAYRELLKVAVNDRLPDGGSALYLSGGLDSSSVCAIASQISAAGQKEKLKAFTISWKPFFEDPEPDFASISAQHLGIAHEILEEAELHPYEQVESKEGYTPEPNDEILFARGRRTAQRIAAHANVVLSGDGGDNVLTGQSWPYLTYLWQRREWHEIARDFGGYLWSHKSIPPLRGGFRTRILQFFNTKDPFADYPSWLNPEFETRTNLRQRWLALRDSKKNTEHPVHPEAYEALHDGYWAAILETEEAGWSRVLLESRAPLLDLRLLTFLLRLPAVPWCMNKYLCRQAMKGLLPGKILSRPKTPLVVDPLEKCLEPGDWTTSVLNAVPARTESFVNWPKWCETLYRSKGSLTPRILRPATLFYWLKAIESKEWFQYSESRGA
jgi:asparagine synthase (glutamine-hydrolysing)